MLAFVKLFNSREANSTWERCAELTTELRSDTPSFTFPDSCAYFAKIGRFLMCIFNSISS